MKWVEGKLVADLDEQHIVLKIEGSKPLKWFLDLTTKPDANLPSQKISSSQIDCGFEGMNYTVSAQKGLFSKPNDEIVFRVTPHENEIVLNMAGENATK